MFRKAQSIYCFNEEIAKQVRAYAQQLNLQAGGRAIVSAEGKCKHSLQSSNPSLVSKGIPDLILEIMNGGYFPNEEDLTREERLIVYDSILNPLLKVYRISHRPETEEQIKLRLAEIRG